MRQEWVGKRHSVRTNVQLRAQMFFGVDRPPLDCMIMDISLTGARIVLPADLACPEDFDVFIPARSETRWARVRWREKRQVGVEFLQGSRDGADLLTEPHLVRLAKVEARLDGGEPRDDASNTGGAIEARLSAIEARLLDPENVKTASSSDAEGAPTEALLDRLARLEARCGAIECAGAAEIDRAERRADDLATCVKGLGTRLNESSSSMREARAHDGKLNVDETRLLALETSVGELRASLRTLILLMSARIKQSGARP